VCGIGQLRSHLQRVLVVIWGSTGTHARVEFFSCEGKGSGGQRGDEDRKRAVRGVRVCACAAVVIVTVDVNRGGWSCRCCRSLLLFVDVGVELMGCQGRVVGWQWR